LRSANGKDRLLSPRGSFAGTTLQHPEKQPTRQGNDVTCDNGRRGIFTSDAIIWPEGTRSNLASQHRSVVIGNKSSVIVGQGVMVGGPSCN
jgi:hypothetical protein